jgi:hypothetical protein
MAANILICVFIGVSFSVVLLNRLRYNNAAFDRRLLASLPIANDILAKSSINSNPQTTQF